MRYTAFGRSPWRAIASKGPELVAIKRDARSHGNPVFGVIDPHGIDAAQRRLGPIRDGAFQHLPGFAIEALGCLAVGRPAAGQDSESAVEGRDGMNR